MGVTLFVWSESSNMVYIKKAEKPVVFVSFDNVVEF
jgi:hypothetical protein